MVGIRKKINTWSDWLEGVVLLWNGLSLEAMKREGMERDE